MLRDGVVLGQLLRAARARLLAGEGQQQARVHDAGAGGHDHREPVDVEHVPGVDHDVGPAAQAGLGEGGVDGARGEDGRDGESCRVLERGGRIGQDEDLGPGAGGVERAGGESVERDLEAGIAAGGRPRRVEPAHGPVRRPGAVADRVEQPVEVDDHRASDPHGLGARGHAAQERRPAAELHLEVHDRPLALGVDRRVGDLRERLAEVVAGGTRDARPPGERRVVAHAPQRLVRVERHRPHVEAQLLGVQPEQVAQGGGRRGDALGRRSRGSGRLGRRPGTRTPVGPSASAKTSRGASWSGRRRRTHDFASASVSTRPAAGSTRSSSPGARRPVRTISPGSSGTAPASDATATRRSAVIDHAAGRRPLRSSSAPTRRPSLNTNAPGPSHGATNPATRRRKAATAGCGVRRRPGASGTSASSAVSSDQPVATSSSSASSSDRESETPGERRGPAARRRSAASRRRDETPASSRRPRIASRLPRTVLISPLWAT